MKKIILLFAFVSVAIFGFSQGLEQIVVETYYVADATDATDPDGVDLYEGSVTYRVWVDMLPGYELQAVYGDANHDLFIATTTEFFNNEDRGTTTGDAIGATRIDDGTVGADSYVTVGGGSAGHIAVIKTEDADGSILGLDGYLMNNDPAAGIPLTTADGLHTGSPEETKVLGVDVSMFDAVNDGTMCFTNNGAWSSLNGSVGATSSNMVLIAQITTNGDLTFELNIQLGTPQGGTENYVARDPIGNEIEWTELIYPEQQIPGCMSQTACNYDPDATIDDGSCLEPVPDCYVCDGDTIAIIDTDGDGVCDANEVPGCTSETACNYNPSATDDDGSCVEPVPDCWECDGDTVAMVDTDGDGICDANDPLTLGLNDVIVETYYISDATDATETDGGYLAEGSVTYRVYMDLNEGFELQAVYGDANHELFVETTSEFYNNNDRGATTADAIGASRIDDGTVGVDSYVSVGGGSDGHMGVLKTLDTDGSILGTSGYLTNNDPAAGIPLTTADGLLTGAPEETKVLGVDLSMFDATNSGVRCSTTNGAWSSLNGSVGPTEDNMVLVGQFTTTGALAFELNVQLGTPSGGTQNFVAQAPQGDEIYHPGLTFLASIPGCTSSTACNYDEHATVDDGSCLEPVDDCWECDGDTIAMIDTDGDGVCDAEEVYGCDDQAACNYDENATENDGSCLYPVDNCWECDGDTVAMIDTDGDGVCDAEEVYGCTSETACNYDTTATEDDGSCVEPVDSCIVCLPGGTWELFDTDGDGICDAEDPYPNNLPYKIQFTEQSCITDGLFCLPVLSLDTIADVIGFDAVMTYDASRVTPTGNVTIAGIMIDPAYADYTIYIDAPNEKVNLAFYLNGQAPVGTSWNGSGEVFCVEFIKTAGMGYVDEAEFSIEPDMVESYLTGIQHKLVEPGVFATYKDSLFTGTLEFWNGNAPIAYDAANPNDYLITNIYGSDSSCTVNSTIAVQPDLNGVFVYSIWNGKATEIKRDILSTTDPMPVINGWDALKTQQVVVNDLSYIPNTFNIISMDVNTDGYITSGDVSQINQRTVMIIDEFRQAWNYDNQGNPLPGYELSKDWLFIDDVTPTADPAYQISASYPSDDGTGFSKWRVPVLAHCLPVPMIDYDDCPVIYPETYLGLLLGDVNGNYKNIAPDGVLKNADDIVVFDLINSVNQENYIDIPVYLNTENTINALDFSLNFSDNLTFVSVENQTEDIELLSNTEGNKLMVTSFSLSSYAVQQPLITLRFAMNSETVENGDLFEVSAYTNGDPASYLITDMSTGSDLIENSDLINIYPNPNKGIFNLEIVNAEQKDVNITLLDLTGKVIFTENVDNVSSLVREIDVTTYPKGVYLMKIMTDDVIQVNKVVVQ